MSVRNGTVIVITALLALVARPVHAQESVRQQRVTLQAGPGVYIFLPSFRLVGRYSLEDVSFELRAGVFGPSFVVHKLTGEAAAAIRYHFLRRERITGFVAPRVGLWSITDEDGPRREAPMATVTGGADFHWGAGWTATVEGGAGLAWHLGSNPPIPVAPLIELNAYLGWTF